MDNIKAWAFQSETDPTDWMYISHDRVVGEQQGYVARGVREIAPSHSTYWAMGSAFAAGNFFFHTEIEGLRGGNSDIGNL